MRAKGKDTKTLTATVRAYGHLRRYMPARQERVELEFDEGTTVGDLIDRVGLPRAEVWVVSIGDEAVEESEPVPDGALVTVMAPVEGG